MTITALPIDAAPPRTRAVAYALTTGYLAITALVAGVLDVLHAPPLYDVLLRLGYPPHLATMLGTWKILGALALVAPRLPRLKEWAYAGMAFDFVAALVAHLVARDPATAWGAPIVSAIVHAASWWLRPASRRLEGPLL